MFNNHFFVLNQKESYFDFLNKSKKLLLVIDPPYGGIVKLIANSLELIKKGCLFFFADMLIKNYTFIICKLFA
jgi:hypothetical protein